MKPADLRKLNEAVRQSTKTLKEFTVDKDGKPVHSTDDEKVFDADNKANNIAMNTKDRADYNHIHDTYVKGKGYTHIIANGKKHNNINDNCHDSWNELHKSK